MNKGEFRERKISKDLADFGYRVGFRDKSNARLSKRSAISALRYTSRFFTKLWKGKILDELIRLAAGSPKKTGIENDIPDDISPLFFSIWKKVFFCFSNFRITNMGLKRYV